MSNSVTRTMDLKAILKKGMTHDVYRAEFDKAVAEGRDVGPPANGYGAEYTKLNLARTRRLEKTLKVGDEVRAIMAKAPAQTWIVLTEMWCGDSAQNLPVIHALAELAPSIELRVLLRDENLELMDKYLTGGSRGIPKLIAFETATGNELFTWGPRPVSAQTLVLTEKPMVSKEQLAESLHRWYNSNGGQDVAMEISALVERNIT